MNDFLFEIVEILYTLVIAAVLLSSQKGFNLRDVIAFQTDSNRTVFSNL